MPYIFEDTRNIDADHYLEGSREYEDRAAFIAEGFPAMLDNESVYMVYLGGGYCPLRIAVIASNKSDAIETVEDYMREHDRAEEIGEDVDEDDPEYGEYESNIQTVPSDIVRGLTPPPPPEPETRYHTLSRLAGAVVFPRYRDGAYKLTGTVRKTDDSPLEVEVYPFDMSRAYRYYVPASWIMRWPR
ncbi:MAG: hypothetical protein ACXWQ5_01025 [Ktedonobacterales bacterium]